MKPDGHGGTHKNPYRRLVLMAVLSFMAMYVLMYAMVDRLANVYLNWNQFYMAGLMAAPMVLIELVLMISMYQNKKLNALIGAASLVILGVFWILIRQQTAISDRQFLRSMIPHHSSALLMCNQASITDDEIRELCRSIVSSQQSEIDLMKAKLNQLGR